MTIAIEKEATKKARRASKGEAAVGTAIFTGSLWACLATWFSLAAKSLGTILGIAGAGIATIFYAANDEETKELSAKDAENPKLSLKSEAVSAGSVCFTIISFSSKPLKWLVSAIAWPLAIVCTGIVMGCTWWKNKQHEKLRQKQTPSIPPSVTSPQAPENWKKLGAELQAEILALEDLTTEKTCGSVVAAIYGCIVGASIYAIIKTCSYLTITAICPPLGLAIGIGLLALAAARKFYNKFMKGAKAAANKQINEIRATVGLAPKLEDHQTKSSTNSFLIAASTFLGVLALITNPILKLIDAVGMAVGAACVYFGALFKVKSRAVRRAVLVNNVRKATSEQQTSTSPQEKVPVAIAEIPSQPSNQPNTLTTKPYNSFRELRDAQNPTPTLANNRSIFFTQPRPTLNSAAEVTGACFATMKV